MKFIDGSITSVPGVLASGVHAGFKPDKKDFALIYFPEGATIAGVFTLNKVYAHHVAYCREALKEHTKFKALAVNSGNANACNGYEGYQALLESTHIVADALDILPTEVLPASTGVIGSPFQANLIEGVMAEAKEALSSKGGAEANEAILTTDKMLKHQAYEVEISGQKITFGAITKGSTMIHPNLGTMLSFITTDIQAEQALLNQALGQATKLTFNRLLTDGHTSTNDTVLVCATGQSSVQLTETNYAAFVEALTEVCQDMAQRIAVDGGGSTKFITVQVEGAHSEEEAVQLGKYLARSPLMKATLSRSDPNWGRVSSGIGSSDIEHLDPEAIQVFFESERGSILVWDSNQFVHYLEEDARQIILEQEIVIRIVLNQGEHSASIWTCDMSEDFVEVTSKYARL